MEEQINMMEGKMVDMKRDIEKMRGGIDEMRNQKDGMNGGGGKGGGCSAEARKKYANMQKFAQTCGLL